MKIWFDRTRSQPITNTDCHDCDCGDCGDCPTYTAFGSSLSFQGDVQQIRNRVFQSTTLLHTQAYGSGLWLICNPVESGHIAVVDQSVFTLLEQFRVSSRPVGDILSNLNLHIDSTEKAVVLLYCLNFLHDIYFPSSTHVQKQMPSRIVCKGFR